MDAKVLFPTAARSTDAMPSLSHEKQMNQKVNDHLSIAANVVVGLIPAPQTPRRRLFSHK
jgi:hypothetical protein